MTLSMTASDYVDMIMGKLNGQMAFMSGKLKISGDMGLAMKMQSLFKRPGA
jgi:putative sterol carrier protein